MSTNGTGSDSRMTFVFAGPDSTEFKVQIAGCSVSQFAIVIAFLQWQSDKLRDAEFAQQQQMKVQVPLNIPANLKER